MSAAP
ncbi:MAG: hypothetical protein K0R45_2583, partial [Pseudomonas sp.]|jgi:hypothetical protein